MSGRHGGSGSDERRHFEGVLERRGALYWAERTAAGRRRRESRSTEIVSGAAVGQRADARVLEIGCGTGGFTVPIARRMPGRLVGIDVAPALLRHAKRSLPSNAAVVAADVENLPFASQSFDAVVGNAVLHHLRLERAVPELLRVLRPGGRLCFAEPNMLNPQVFLERNVRWIGRLLDNSPDETAFLRRRVCRDLARLGVDGAAARPFDFLYPLTPAWLIRPVERLGALLERIPGIREIAGSLVITGTRPQ